ncbi:UNVERIFIED_CONTAM: hypothetical protein NCL1_50104 [Trichonephila clavipes]
MSLPKVKNVAIMRTGAYPSKGEVASDRTMTKRSRKESKTWPGGLVETGLKVKINAEILDAVSKLM